MEKKYIYASVNKSHTSFDLLGDKALKGFTFREWADLKENWKYFWNGDEQALEHLMKYVGGGIIIKIENTEPTYPAQKNIDYLQVEVDSLTEKISENNKKVKELQRRNKENRILIKNKKNAIKELKEIK